MRSCARVPCAARSWADGKDIAADTWHRPWDPLEVMDVCSQTLRDMPRQIETPLREGEGRIGPCHGPELIVAASLVCIRSFWPHLAPGRRRPFKAAVDAHPPLFEAVVSTGRCELSGPEPIRFNIGRVRIASFHREQRIFVQVCTMWARLAQCGDQAVQGASQRCISRRQDCRAAPFVDFAPLGLARFSRASAREVDDAGAADDVVTRSAWAHDTSCARCGRTQRWQKA